MSKHNKKRNVGIMYELLLNYVSKSLIEGNKKEAKKATKIIERNFKKGTELYKEFRLFNALATSKVSNTHTTASILYEAKKAAKNNINLSKLEREKSTLIRDINYNLSKDFYYDTIQNYRDLGAIQLALNEWRSNTPDIQKIVKYETKLTEIMLNENKVIKETAEKVDVSHSDRLVLKLMTEKFNRHYGENLTSDQKSIIKHYVFYSEKNKKVLKEYFVNKKKEAIIALNNFEDNCDNKYLLEKIDGVYDKIKSLDENKINDETVVKFLSVTKLISELKKGV